MSSTKTTNEKKVDVDEIEVENSDAKNSQGQKSKNSDSKNSDSKNSDSKNSKNQNSQRSENKKPRKQKKNTGRFAPAEYDWDKLTDKEKRDIKKYGNPHKLGFLRFLMIIFGFFAIGVVVSAFLVTKDTIVVDVAFFGNLVDCILYTIVFVLIWQRKKATRIVGASIFAIDIIFSIIDYFVKIGLGYNEVALFNIIGSIVLNVLCMIYFLTSRRVKYACTRPLSLNETTRDSETEYYNFKTWAFWRDLIIMFFIFSIVGHWAEFCYCLPIKWGLIPGTYDPNNQIWHDFVFPFPIYGGGAVACALIFWPIKEWLSKKTKNKVLTFVLVFILAGVVTTLMELIMGLCTNQDLQQWDYSNMFCNFMGQVCLQNSLAFATVATLVTYIAYPLLKDLFHKLDKYMNIIFIAVVVFGSLNFIFYYFNALPEMMKEIDPDIYNQKMSVSNFK